MNADDFMDTDDSGNDKQYKRFNKREFEDFLTDHWVDWNRVKPNEGVLSQTLSFSTEYIYKIPVSSTNRLYVVIFSTIDHRTNKARDKGKDAIRTVLYDNKTKSIIGGRKKTLRINTWKDNLKRKVDDLLQNTEEYVTECDECNGFMVEREGQYGKFLGCTNYPDCRNTKQLHANK